MSLANGLDDLGVDQIVRGDLGELGEVPSIPLLQSHHVVVDLFFKVVQEGDGLDDHDVHLFRGELELVPGQSVGDT